MQEDDDLETLLGPELAQALAKKRYTQLTAVQRAVLDPALRGRDLRISSQTGSGKTLAIGFILRDALAHGDVAAKPQAPRALVVTPTRELAKQVESELGWLYAPSQVRVVSLTGGASYRDEHRGLARGPGIVVGTPGRLLDHLRRGSLDASALSAVVLDEADRMLDLGFRDDIEAILGMAPKGRRTHLVSATFVRDVLRLADSVQTQPVHVQGTPLGTANTDIEHVLHLVQPRERLNAVINLLLAEPGTKTLIFARTRADVADIAEELRTAGFSVGSLSGEMEQNARTRALGSFKRGELNALVATDVAARGIDVQEIERVIQVEPPTDPDTYTHRSGRTGRAGRKGTSSVLVPPSALNKVISLLKRAQVRYRTEPIPTAESIRAARDERLFGELTSEEAPGEPADARAVALSRRILESGQGERALSRLVARLSRSLGGEPRQVTPMRVEEPASRAPRRPMPARSSRGDDRGRPHDRARPHPGSHAPRHPGSHAPRHPGSHAPRSAGPHAPPHAGSHAPRHPDAARPRKAPGAAPARKQIVWANPPERARGPAKAVHSPRPAPKKPKRPH